MYPPDKTCCVLLGITLAGGATFITWTMLSDSVQSSTAGRLLMLSSVATTLICYVLTMRYVTLSLAYKKVMSGEDLLAQWKVTPQLARAFLDSHSSDALQETRYPNAFAMIAEPGGEDMQVRLGKNMVIVDGRYKCMPNLDTTCHFDDLALVDGPPMFMHMRVTYPLSKRRFAVTLPVPESAQADVRHALKQYEKLSIATRKTLIESVKRLCEPLVQLSLLLAGTAAIASGWVFLNYFQPAQLSTDAGASLHRSSLGLITVGATCIVIALAMAGFSIVKIKRQTGNQS